MNAFLHICVLYLVGYCLLKLLNYINDFFWTHKLNRELQRLWKNQLYWQFMKAKAKNLLWKNKVKMVHCGLWSVLLLILKNITTRGLFVCLGKFLIWKCSIDLEFFICFITNNLIFFCQWKARAFSLNKVITSLSYNLKSLNYWIQIERKEFLNLLGDFG